eukprot:1143037-Pelagomonas_calceolata.AAC.3
MQRHQACQSAKHPMYKGHQLAVSWKLAGAAQPPDAPHTHPPATALPPRLLQACHDGVGRAPGPPRCIFQRPEVTRRHGHTGPGRECKALKRRRIRWAWRPGTTTGELGSVIPWLLQKWFARTSGGSAASDAGTITQKWRSYAVPGATTGPSCSRTCLVNACTHAWLSVCHASCPCHALLTCSA